MPYNKGFTLIEILIVIGLFTFIFALGLFMSMDVYRGYTHRSERDVLVSVLTRARSRALANIHQQRWGVCYDNNISQYVIFSGANYVSALSKETVLANPGVTFSTSSASTFFCSAGGIIFTQLTGTTTGMSVGMTQGAFTSTTSTNVEGVILW